MSVCLRTSVFIVKGVSPLDQVKETCAATEPELRCIDFMTLIS